MRNSGEFGDERSAQSLRLPPLPAKQRKHIQRTEQPRTPHASEHPTALSEPLTRRGKNIAKSGYN